MKTIQARNYNGDRTETGDYKKVHDFLVKSNCVDYTYGRFDWMMTNWEYLEDRYLNRIGIWEEEGEVVGVALFDHSLDIIFPIVLEGYERLYGEMITYAADHMVKEADPEFLIYANDANETLIRELKRQGFIATEEKDMVAMYDFVDPVPECSLPDGYSFTTLLDEEDYEKYLYCMFRGFGHEESGEEFHYDEQRESEMKQAYHRAYLDRSLKISIKDSEGNYVAHCGMWFDKNSHFALIEPVCVVPKQRKLGLGKEVVYEGLRRVKDMGASMAVVGSSQQFYYSLGLIPFRTGTIWKPKK